MAAPINMALYRLLIKQGADESEAEEAARIDASDLATKVDLAEVRGDVRVVQWMLGFVLALLAAMFWQGFAIMGRLGRLP